MPRRRRSPTPPAKRPASRPPEQPHRSTLPARSALAPRGSTLERARPLRVLVVDDDRDARAIYSMFLRAVGCRVHTAHDGRQAIEQANAHLPDVIVLDLAMPLMDGWEAAERLKHSPATRHIPIVALTAQPGARESAHISGCDAFLAKPCMPQLLWCEISLLLAHNAASN